MTRARLPMRLREWTQRVRGAITGRRTDRDLQRELEAHLAFAEDELIGQGHAPQDAARLARAAAGGRVQAIEALRAQRGLPGLASSWLDVRLGLRLLARNRWLTLVAGLAMTVAIGIAAVVFTAIDVMLWSALPLEDGDRVVAIQVWDREAGRRRDTAWRDVERWRDSLHSIDDVGAFQTIRRNAIAADGSIELVPVAEMSSAGFRVAKVPPLIGRTLLDADAAPGATPVVVIGHDVWQRRFAGASDIVGRELRLGERVHAIVGVMPAGFRFPFNFQYWIPLRPEPGDVLQNAGPEGVVFGRLTGDATLSRAHAEIAALGTVAPTASASSAAATGPRVVPYTFAFTGDFERGEMGMLWSLSTVLLALLLLPPCANIAILNYARTVTRQQEFAARHALGGSRARIVSQLFIEALVLSAASAAAALLILRAVSTVVEGRLQAIPGGPPFWLTFGVSYRTLLFVAALAVTGAAISGLVPALQATGRLARLGAGALAGRTSLRLGGTWTTLVIAQVAFSVAALPIAAQLAWGTMRSGVVGPGFAADEFASARIGIEGDDTARLGARRAQVVEQLLGDPAVLGVAPALRPPGEEPWVFVDIEGREAPAESLNGPLPGFRARFNAVDAAFFEVYEVPRLAGRAFLGGDADAADAVVINRNFADTIAPAGNALGHRFRYVGGMGDDESVHPILNRWYEVVGIVGNLPATTDARVAYHPAAASGIDPAHLQLRFRGAPAHLAGRVREIAARVDPTLQVDEVRTLAEIYREHRFGDNIGALTIAAVTASVLLLSAAGLYALMTFTVAQRRREIGIRAALGARPGQLVGAVFRRALWQVCAGSALGMAAAYTVGLYVPIEQIGGLPLPGILPGAAAFMLLIGAVAAAGPARRSLRIHPTEALRSD